VNDKVDGICIAPIDRDALIEPIRRAKQAGIPVVVFDSGLSDTSDIVSYVATEPTHHVWGVFPRYHQNTHTGIPFVSASYYSNLLLFFQKIHDNHAYLSQYSPKTPYHNRQSPVFAAYVDNCQAEHKMVQ
jgi:hypothetical protein